MMKKLITNSKIKEIVEMLTNVDIRNYSDETESEGKIANAFFCLSSAAARRMPKEFKNELAKSDHYQNRKYIVRMSKYLRAEDSKITYSVYLYTRLLGEKRVKISGSGDSLAEAERAFVEAIRAVKLPA